MRYDRLRRVLVVLVAGLLFSPTALFPQKNSSSVPPARFTSVKGKVTVQGPLTTEVKRAVVFASIEPGVTISTGEDSRATVELKDGSTIEVKELTRVVVTSWATDSNNWNEIALKQGFASFHTLSERPNALVVNTSGATLTPHGAAVFEALFEKQRVQLGVQAGAVTVAAKSRSIVLRKGQVMTFDPLTAEELPASHVRVVRLSFVNGTVTVKRPNASTWEKAMVNLPVQEGFELSTSSASYAEMQFENGSTARVGELTDVKIYELGLGASGDKLNGLELEQGYATFNFVPEQEDALHVKVGDARLTPSGKSEFRTDIAQDHYRVEVFKGSVDVAVAARSTELEAGKVLERQVGSAELAFNIDKKITKDDWDRWTEARDSQAERTTRDQPVGASGMVAGWSDLDTYGEWVQIAGRGMGWSPYAPAGWSPYTMGNWGWYPGMGYTWNSSEPWGWLPYHCGLWDFDNAFGWYWSMPMNGCMFWQPALVNWYSGPGWIGWGPRGNGTPATLLGRPGHGPGHPVPPGTHIRLTAGSGRIVTVPTQVFERNQTITPGLVAHAFAGPSARPMAEPSPPPASSLGVRSGPPGGALAAGGATAPAVTAGLGAGLGPHHSSAPASILMGGDPSKEGALLSGHYHHSGSEPLRAREGNTLGGHYNVRGSVGEFRGEAFRGGPGTGAGAFRGGTQGFGNGGISVSHQSGGGTPHGGWTGGSVSASSGGHVGSSSSGGGFGGGHSSAGPSGGGYSRGGGHSGGGGGFSGGGHSGGGGGFSGGGGGGGHAGGGGGGGAASGGGGGGGGHH